MNLSVVIPTRNRAPVLQRCLEALLTQTIPGSDFEILVVDNGSNDRTAGVCEVFKGSFPDFRYVGVREPGLHNGRHAGLRHAKGDILVYCDDDIEASPTWLEGVRDAFKRPEIALVGGPALPNLEASAPAWFDKLKIHTDDGWWIGPYSLIDFGRGIHEIPPRMVFGCNFSIRRDVLEQIGGFHPDGMPRDKVRFRGDGETAVSDAVDARGLKALYHPEASVRHLVSGNRLTLEYLHWRGYLQGISDSYADVRRSGSLVARSLAEKWLRGRKAVLKEAYKALKGRGTEVEAFVSRRKKTPLEEVEDIEILRFLELGWDVRMIPMSDASIAVDNPEDVAKAEARILELGL